MTALQSDTLAEIGTALAKAQASLAVAVKDTTGQIGQNRNYKYADLGAVWDAARDALATNGLSVIQRPHPCEGGVKLQTTILHSSGEWISDGGLTLPAQKVDPQGFGSALTYARRYGLAAMLGIVQDDDDGAAAVRQQAEARERAARAAAAPKVAGVQAQILTAIAKAARPDRDPDLSDKLAEDYEHHLDAFLRFAVKEGALDEATALDVRSAAAAHDIDTVTTHLTREAIPA